VVKRRKVQESKVGFAEVSSFYIDVLKDECSNPDKDGWYTVFPPKEENEQPSGVIGDLEKQFSKFNTGPWSDEEHQRFLESLKIYGKDWEAI